MCRIFAGPSSSCGIHEYLLSDNVSYPNAPRGMSWIDEMYVLYVCIPCEAAHLVLAR